MSDPPAHILFFIDGPPVPCGRARVVKAANGVTHAFNPKSTQVYQKHCRTHAVMAAANAGHPFGFGAVSFREANFSVHLYVGRASKRGDTDNFAKSVMDACTGVFWKDDSQVKTLSVTMIDVKDLPGIHVTIETLRPDIFPFHAENRYRQLAAQALGQEI
jgi:Holliday junction resolvase RusA-like endonuclease